MGNKLLFIGIVLLNSCMRVINPKERNVIIFEGKIDSVACAIQEINNYLITYDNINLSYGISQEGYLYVDTSNTIKKVGNINDTTLYNSDLLLFFDEKEKSKEFINLAFFLYKNHLSNVIKRKDKYLYYYRNNVYMADKQEDMLRYIVYANNKSAINDLLEDKFVKTIYGGISNLGYKIIHQRGNLFLLANKDAKIWED